MLFHFTVFYGKEIPARKEPWTPCRYVLLGLFLAFLTFVLHVSFSIANSSFKNKNWYNKVTSYPMDLT